MRKSNGVPTIRITSALVKRIPTGAVKVMGVALRQHAPAGAVHVGRDVQRADELDGLVMTLRSPDLLAEQHRGPLRLDQNIRQLSRYPPDRRCLVEAR